MLIKWFSAFLILNRMPTSYVKLDDTMNMALSQVTLFLAIIQVLHFTFKITKKE